MKKSLWVSCSIYKNKTRIKIHKDTVLEKFPLFAQNASNRADNE